MVLFAGKELSNKLEYLKKQSKELKININYPKKFSLLVRLYIAVFGIPEIGIQERFRLFQKITKNLKPKTIIDAGCGSGIYSRHIATKFPHSQIHAFDIEDKLITLNKKINSNNNLTYLKHDLTMPLFPKIEKVDFLYSIDVLEHIKNYEKVLTNFYQILKNGGYLFIHVPLARQRRWFKYFKKWDHKTHVRKGFDEKQLLKKLSNLNFKIIKKQGTFGLFGSFFWELNTLLFKKAPFIAIFLYPMIRLLLPLDNIFKSKKYNCLGIIAQKK